MFCESRLILLISLIFFHLEICHGTASQISNVEVSSFMQDDKCQVKSQSGGMSLSQIKVRSRIQCAIQCISDERCQYFQHIPSDGECELFTLSDPAPNSVPSTVPSNTNLSKCYQFNSAPTIAHSTNMWLNKDNDAKVSIEITTFSVTLNVTNPTHTPETNLRKGDWKLLTDSNYPATQTHTYMESLKGTFKETRSLLQPRRNTWDIITNDFFHFGENGLYTFMAYRMSHKGNTFPKSSSRAILMTWSNAHWSRVYLSLDNQVDGVKKNSRTKIFGDNEYDKQLETIEDNIPILISWLRSGYKVYDFTYAKVWRDHSAVSLFCLNKKLTTKEGEVNIPVEFHQQLHIFPSINYWMKNQMSNSSKQVVAVSVETLDEIGFLFVSSYWMPFDDESKDESEQIQQIISYLLHGHAFRVGFKDSFYDLDTVFRFKDDVLFLLPQQVDAGSLQRLSQDSFGLRAFVSLRGRLSWCTHPLQGVQVLDSGQETGIQLVPYVDKKEWTLAASVHSNGTIKEGNIKNLSNEVHEGKTIAVVIQWLSSEMMRRLSISYIKTENYGKDNVHILAESQLSWHLIHTGKEDQFVMSPQCDMEKFLISSRGTVKVLVYNTGYTLPVTSISDVVVMWYTH